MIFKMPSMYLSDYELNFNPHNYKKIHRLMQILEIFLLTYFRIAFAYVIYLEIV